MAPTARLVGPGLFVVERDGVQHRVYAVRDGARTWIFHEGFTHLSEAARRTGPAGRAATEAATPDDSALAAPMPATVVRVLVQEGQTVRVGDVLVTLEAMKMELPIHAPRDGRITRVRCREGELVHPGVPLLEMA
ncbi:MAG: biotin/lipoyl-binding protein [Acidobacteria bacterium]|nr:biotin/lipoyl-binding protein [Acidobacteriota bacterium]